MSDTDSALLRLARAEAKAAAPRLSEEELRTHLAALPDWSRAGEAIEKTFRFAGYAETIGFVNAVAWVAQRLDHHPDLEVGFSRCRVVWTTHDAKGITLNDCIAAARVEQLLR